VPLTLSARTPDGRTHSGHFEFQHSERPILAWASTAGGDQPDADVHLLAVSAADLPHLAQGYGSIAGIAIDDLTLKALDDAQALALLQHVRSCGFTVLLGVSEDAAAALRDAAGCGGRQLISAAASATATDALRFFTEREQSAPLSSAAVGALAPDDQRLGALQAALLSYAVLACAALLLLRRTAALWAVPPLATAALALTFHLTPPRQQAIVWAEARSGDAQASFTGRLRLRGMAPVRADVQMPALIEAAQSCDASAATVTHWDAQQQRALGTSLPLRMLATDDFCFAGNFPLSYRAQARLIDPGTLQLANNGAAAWDDARLLWQGKVYRSGSMPAAASRQITPSNGAMAATAAERVGLARLTWNQAGLLLPLQLSSLAGEARSAAGWLFLRIPVEAQAGP
jgi:hypothetical protein